MAAMLAALVIPGTLDLIINVFAVEVPVLSLVADIIAVMVPFCDGVPEITPVVGLITKPRGKLAALKEVTRLRAVVVTAKLIAIPWVQFIEEED